MKQKVVSIGDINVANDLLFVLFGGMNVLTRFMMRICEHYVTVTQKLHPFTCLCFLRCANRPSIRLSWTGPGRRDGNLPELKQTLA